MLLATAASKAGAVPPAAEMLFREGRQLMAEGNTPEACTRFGQSFALDPASGTLLNLALCHEKQGRTATAWAEYQNAAVLSRNQGRKDRAAAAEERIVALEPVLARLTLVAPNPAPGLDVWTEEDRPSALHVGVATPLDPGVYHLRAEAPGRRPWTATVKIAEAEQRTLEIPELEPDAPAFPSVAPTPPLTPSPVLVMRSPAPASTTSASRRSLDLYVAAGGGALIVAGTVVWEIAYSRFRSAEMACNQGSGCADYADRLSTINRLGDVAIGTWIVGGAAVLVSGLHYKLRKPPAPVQVAIDPWDGQVVVRGTF